MKTIKSTLGRRVAAAALPALLFAQRVVAQTYDAGSKITTMTSEIKTIAGKTVNLGSAVIGLVAVILLVWNYFRRSKGDGQGNDALASWLWGIIFAMVGLQVVSRVLL